MFDSENHPTGGVYCMINSGGVDLSPRVCDVLMYNAVCMIQENCHAQQVRGRGYDGIIQSDLRVIEHAGGFPIVNFSVMLAVDKWKAGKVTFFVRTDDLEVYLTGGNWCRIMASVIGLPPGIDPEQAMAAIKRGEGIPIPMDQVPPETREELEKFMLGMPDDDDDDEPEYDVGKPTGGYGD